MCVREKRNKRDERNGEKRDEIAVEKEKKADSRASPRREGALNRTVSTHDRLCHDALDCGRHVGQKLEKTKGASSSLFFFLTTQPRVWRGEKVGKNSIHASVRKSAPAPLLILFFVSEHSLLYRSTPSPQGRAGSPRVSPGGRGSDALAGRGLARQREQQRRKDGGIAFVFFAVVVDGRHGGNAFACPPASCCCLPLSFSVPLPPLRHLQGRSDVPKLASRG